MPALISEFHEGERAMHQLLKVTQRNNPTAPGLPMRYAMRVMQSPLVALGTLDSKDRPWTTIWGGERGFARPVAEGVLAFNSAVDTRYDPVFRALWEGADPQDDAVVRPGGGEGKLMAGLSIDLETRDRVKVAGKMVVGAAVNGGKDVQMAMVVTESLGNCPKYLNKKDVVVNEMKPELVSNSLPLPPQAIQLIEKADMFFLSSTNGTAMDTNHRGGNPGFMRVVRNEKSLELIYPEFSGNRLYQTLGNFKVNPLVGIAMPDFETADVLYLTGSATVLVGEEASSLLARSQLAVKITVSEARFVKSGLPFRGDVGEFSPYNPPIRHLLSGRDTHIASGSSQPDISASLVKREVITPTINRFTFQLSARERIPKWEPGQHITFDFEPELGAGYSHMRDDDPQSLNDDYIRTFTISSPPGGSEIEVTMRKHGPATNFLWRYNTRVPLDIPVLGFGGEAAFRMPLDPQGPQPIFIAAGVGITPVLAQAPAVLDAGVPFRLLWSLRAEDLPLAVDTFSKVPSLAGATTLFVTGDAERGEVEKLGTGLQMRRIEKGDVEEFKGKGAKFYLCTGPALLTALGEWLAGEEVVWEDFGY